MKTVTFDETKWQLVPIQPTFLMIEAGDGETGGEEVYRAMLEISPPYRDSENIVVDDRRP